MCCEARRGVIITSMVMLVLQIFGFLGTILFYSFASSDGSRYFVSRAVFTALYHREDWPYLKRTQALEQHVLIAGSIQLFLLPATVLLVIGAITRTRWLLLTWIILFALFQLSVLFSVIACFLWLPKDYKPLAAGVASIETFILFPWWFATLHLFSILKRTQLFNKAEKIYNMNAAELTHALRRYSGSRPVSRRASILPYDGSEMVLPVMVHSNSGTFRRDGRDAVAPRHSIIPYDGSEIITPIIVHSNFDTLRRDGTLGSSKPHHHCCSCDRTSYSTVGRDASYQTGYSDLDI